MSHHLSILKLDELAAGVSSDNAAKTHLDACSECRVRLDSILTARTNTLESPHYEKVRANLQATATASARQKQTSESIFQRLKWVWALSTVLAAAIWIVVMRVPEPQPTSRLKGNASIRVLRHPDGAPITSARPGDRVVLSVASAGLDFGCVLAVDAEHEISAVWPADSAVSKHLPPGGEVHLEPGFEVTPGTIVLHAFFSSSAIPIETLKTQLQKERDVDAQAGKHPPPFAGVVRATMVLQVEP